MNYITNTDRVSTEALSHGLTWGSHRYIRREGTPGNYRYIYPEDKPSFVSRVKSAIQSRNAEGATLFGNPTNRRAYQNKASQVAKMERGYNRALRQVNKTGSKIASETAKSVDASKPEKYRKIHSDKLKAIVSAQQKKISDLANYESLINEAKQRLNSVKNAYDRTRKIDDIAPVVISEVKKLFRPKDTANVEMREVANPSGTSNRNSSKRSVANKRFPVLEPNGKVRWVKGTKNGS